jgi:hypothetical protein
MGNLLTKFLDLEEQRRIKHLISWNIRDSKYDYNTEDCVNLNKVIINHNFCKNFENGISFKTYVLQNISNIDLFCENDPIVKNRVTTQTIVVKRFQSTN